MNDFTEQLSQLESMLKKHDKYYDSSEDHRVWTKGDKEWKDISRLTWQLKIAGYAEEVQELFKKYYV